MHWSDELYRIYGRSRADFQPTTRNGLDFVHPDDLPFVRETSRRVVADGAAFDLEHRIIRADHQVAHVHAVGEVVCDDEGRPSRVIGTVQDITETKEAAAHRREFDRHLQQIQRMEAVGALAAGVAHEFNNLLAVILGNLDLVRTDSSPEAREAVDSASRAARDAAEIARQLLAVGRTTSRARVPLPLDSLVQEVVSMLRPSLGPTVNAPCAVPPGLSVIGNAGQLKQALINLAVNARDAMPAGGRLTIRARRVHGLADDVPLPARADGYAMLEVADTGTGMEAETATRMFDPFFSTKGEAGSGLGAAVVYGILQEHEGLITVDSTPGAATTMRLFIPAAAAGAAEAEAPPPKTPVARARTILIVDDNEPLRRATELILSRAGYAAVCCDGGRAAVDLLHQAGPGIDLALIDCAMPDLNGRQVFEPIREQGWTGPVIFISGNAPGALDGLRQDRWAFLAKPFAAAMLLDRVAGLLAREHPEHVGHGDP